MAVGAPDELSSLWKLDEDDEDDNSNKEFEDKVRYMKMGSKM